MPEAHPGTGLQESEGQPGSARPGRSQREAIAKAEEQVGEGKEWVVDLDLERFSDAVNKDKLVKRGIRREVAYREVYLRNHGRWRLAHTFGVGRAWPEHWFRQQGVVTVSRETRSHWKPLQAYPRVL